MKADKTWEPIATFTTEDDLDPTVFYDTAIRINDEDYYHDDFRFRFISFGRKSGRYDAWHIDYVYLNIRNASDRNTSISDRALTKPFTPAFNEYYAQPYSHFLTDPLTHFSKPFFEANNLKDTVFSQVVNYTSYFKISNYLGGIENVAFNTILDFEEPLASLPSLERATYQFVNLPNTSNFDPLADSAEVSVILAFNSGDNDEDYYSRYKPINFFLNDTLRHTFNLSNYYAYDDGIAEYAAGLTTTGNRLAYGFAMKTDSQDTLNGLFIYFSNFVGEHSSTVEFFILDHDNGSPGAVLHEQLVSVTPKPNNEFSLTPLFEGDIEKGVIVKDTFFIGYRQPTGASIRIGLDKSNNTGHMMYDNTNGSWIQNDRVTGSLMIRPRFGFGEVVITGLPEVPKPVTIYPNPNRGTFYMKGVVDDVQVVNITGQGVELLMEDLGEEKRITITGASSGLYIVRYRSGARIFTEKIFITK